MPSCVLFHGPGAKDAALAAAAQVGPLLVPPFGDDGLKVDDARAFVVASYSIPVGVDIGTLIVGPMDADRANPKACDVLLKRLEGFDDTTIQPFLWAWDIGNVIPTIRSRCLAKWAPADLKEDTEIEIAAETVVTAILEGRFAGVPFIIKKIDAKRIPDFIGALASRLSDSPGDRKRLEIWERLRKVAVRRNPTVVEVTGALVGGF